MTPVQDCIAVAKQFGDSVAGENYQAAHSLLTTEAQAIYSPDDFQKAVLRMTSYAPGPILEVVLFDEVLEDWPGKEDSDVASIYVALNGNGFCEAAFLTIARQGQDMRIREIEWGRP